MLKRIYLDHSLKEDRVVDGHGQVDVSHVPGAVDVVLPAGPAHLIGFSST